MSSNLIPVFNYLFGILVGYWIITHLNITKFRALRESGYHLLFRSAITGLILVGLVTVALTFFETGLLDAYEQFDSYRPNAFAVLLICAALAYLIPHIWNKFYDADRATKREAIINDDAVEILLLEALDTPCPVELTLKNDDFYVGYIIASQSTRQRESDITLVPILSGYRHKSTREMIVTTNYAEITIALRKLNKLKVVNLRIALRMSEIISASLFDRDVFDLRSRYL